PEHELPGSPSPPRCYRQRYDPDTDPDAAGYSGRGPHAPASAAFRLQRSHTQTPMTDCVHDDLEIASQASLLSSNGTAWLNMTLSVRCESCGNVFSWRGLNSGLPD